MCFHRERNGSEIEEGRNGASTREAAGNGSWWKGTVNIMVQHVRVYVSFTTQER